jgi:O-antigen/teichoic acid export membrane protein
VKEVKRLAGQTLIYGLGTMVPRFLNYAILTPLFTYTVKNKPDYGVIVELYAWMVLLLVVLTYGMETGFFRFTKKIDDDRKVYSTAMVSLLVTSSLFILFVNLFIDDVSAFFNYSNNQEYIRMFTAIVAIDAFSAIPFAKLRGDNRPILFSAIKIGNVIVTVSLLLFLLKYAPGMYERGNRFVVSFYNPDHFVRYVFIANLVGSSFTLLLLTPVIFSIRPTFSWNLWKRMIGYSLPLLVAGLAGTINDVIDKVLLRRMSAGDDGLEIVADYGAGYKIAVLMSLFVQMFRFAAEPFFFEKAASKDARESYAMVMKHFIISGLILFLGLNLYIPIVQYFLGPMLREAIVVVPIVSFAYFLYGIYLNLSVWYKINDMTRFGAYFTVTGAAFTLAINIIFIPSFGYMASAWAHVVCYLVMVTLSYTIGRRRYRVEYDVKGFFIYSTVAIAIVLFALYTDWGTTPLRLAVNTLLLAGFVAVAQLRDGTLTLFFKTS